MIIQQHHMLLAIDKPYLWSFMKWIHLNFWCFHHHFWHLVSSGRRNCNIINIIHHIMCLGLVFDYNQLLFGGVINIWHTWKKIFGVTSCGHMWLTILQMWHNFWSINMHITIFTICFCFWLSFIWKGLFQNFPSSIQFRWWPIHIFFFF